MSQNFTKILEAFHSIQKLCQIVRKLSIVSGKFLKCPASVSIFFRNFQLITSKSHNSWLVVDYLLPGVNCTAPPPRPPPGTREWGGGLAYGTRVTYTCGPYGHFRGGGGEHGEAVLECLWNQTWWPPVLEECAGTLTRVGVCCS